MGWLCNGYEILNVVFVFVFGFGGPFQSAHSGAERNECSPCSSPQHKRFDPICTVLLTVSKCASLCHHR